MPQNKFQIAATRARGGFAIEDWASLTFSEQADAIYRQLRLMDLAAEAREVTPPRRRPTVPPAFPEPSLRRNELPINHPVATAGDAALLPDVNPGRSGLSR